MGLPTTVASGEVTPLPWAARKSSESPIAMEAVEPRGRGGRSILGRLGGAEAPLLSRRPWPMGKAGHARGRLPLIEFQITR